jgi:hypothetical protein
MEDVGIFYDHLVNFPAILWPLCLSLGKFAPFGYVVPKNLATLVLEWQYVEISAKTQICPDRIPSGSAQGLSQVAGSFR